MSDYDALMATVIAYPDSDSPRLIFADWLEEHGEEERAEFIRVQCELARTKVMPGWLPSEEEIGRFSADQLMALFRINNHNRESKIESLRRLEREILAGRVDNWIFDVIGERHLTGAFDFTSYPLLRFRYPDRSTRGFEFRRGFVEIITCTWADWLAHHAAIQQATPLREVRLTTRPVLYWNEHNDRDRCQLWKFWKNGKIHGIPDHEWQSIRRDEIPQYEQRKFAELLEAEFGIKFTLPAERANIQPDLDSYAEFRNRLLENAVQSLGIPADLLRRTSP